MQTIGWKVLKIIAALGVRCQLGMADVIAHATLASCKCLETGHKTSQSPNAVTDRRAPSPERREPGNQLSETLRNPSASSCISDIERARLFQDSAASSSTRGGKERWSAGSV